ncbi:MAG: hypothetical protein R3C49_07325 [Planctomycetaceae bacterium]
MSKFKPFLIGAVLGAGAMFVSLQYHLIQSQEGFRLVPRTPQASIGLAYADVRHWTAAEWADRPELARALVAHGSTDLVATSVSGGLMESISSEGSPLDRLRGMMNDSAGSKSGSLFNEPGSLTIPDAKPSDPPARDLFSIPFPQEARQNTPQQVASSFSEKTSTAERSAPAALPSIDEVLNSGMAGVETLQRPVLADREPLPSFNGQSATTATLPGQDSSSSEAQQLEEFLFGEPEAASPADESDASEFSAFEEVTGSIRQETGRLLESAGTSLKYEAQDAFSSYSRKLQDAAQEQVRQAMPDSVAEMFRDDAAQQLMEKAGTTTADHLPPALKAIQNGFDPFVR